MTVVPYVREDLLEEARRRLPVALVELMPFIAVWCGASWSCAANTPLRRLTAIDGLSEV